jgi:hypothetical protein
MSIWIPSAIGVAQRSSSALTAARASSQQSGWCRRSPTCRSSSRPVGETRIPQTKQRCGLSLRSTVCERHATGY